MTIIADVPDVVVVIAAAAAGFAARGLRLRGPEPEDRIRRELMRYRRGGEPAAFLLLETRYDRSLARRMRDCFRVTDVVDVHFSQGSLRVRAVLEERSLDRGALERRLIATVGHPGLTIGWASFPDDGVTADVLMEAARAARTAPGPFAPANRQHAVVTAKLTGGPRPMAVQGEES